MKKITVAHAISAAVFFMSLNVSAGKNPLRASVLAPRSATKINAYWDQSVIHGPGRDEPVPSVHGQSSQSPVSVMQAVPGSEVIGCGQIRVPTEIPPVRFENGAAGTIDRLFADPRFNLLAPKVRRSFHGDWAKLSTRADKLKSDGDALLVDARALIESMKATAPEGCRIKAKLDEINARTIPYNQRCHGTVDHETYVWCKGEDAWYAQANSEYKAMVAALELKIDGFNRTAGQWSDQLDAWNASVAKWDTDADSFEKTLEAAVKGSGSSRASTEDCTFTHVDSDGTCHCTGATSGKDHSYTFSTINPDGSFNCAKSIKVQIP